MSLSFVAVSAVALAAAVAPAGVANADDPMIGLDNTGVSSEVIHLNPVTESQEDILNVKDAIASSIEAQLDAQDAGTASRIRIPKSLNDVSLLNCPSGETCSGTPTDFKIPAAANMTIHSQNKSYTCGPASLKNMVMSMNKTANGEYTSRTEATYEDWLGTGTQGTAIGSIVNVLNSKYSQFGGWQLKDPSDKNAYLAHVMTDTHAYKQPLIQGVKTIHLPYFEGHNLNHFNFVYGYQRSTDIKRINVGEVWDPVKIYGSADYQPYGHQKPTLASVFEANHNSGPNGGGARLIV